MISIYELENVFWIYDFLMIFYDVLNDNFICVFFMPRFMLFKCLFYDYFSAHVALIKPLKKSYFSVKKIIFFHKKNKKVRFFLKWFFYDS